MNRTDKKAIKAVVRAITSGGGDCTSPPPKVCKHDIEIYSKATAPIGKDYELSTILRNIVLRESLENIYRTLTDYLRKTPRIDLEVYREVRRTARARGEFVSHMFWPKDYRTEYKESPSHLALKDIVDLCRRKELFLKKSTDEVAVFVCLIPDVTVTWKGQTIYLGTMWLDFTYHKRNPASSTTQLHGYVKSRGFPHPHAADGGNLCHGGMFYQLRQTLVEGRVGDYLNIVCRLVRTYTAYDPVQPVENWLTVPMTGKLRCICGRLYRKREQHSCGCGFTGCYNEFRSCVYCHNRLSICRMCYPHTNPIICDKCYNRYFPPCDCMCCQEDRDHFHLAYRKKGVGFITTIVNENILIEDLSPMWRQQRKDEYYEET